MAKFYRGTKGNLQFLARRLRAGELVAVPSETVYGLAANALSAQACRRIFAAKGRPANDPLIVHVGSIAAAEKIAEINETARRLMRRFCPGPLTLVLPKKAVIPDLVTSGQSSVAIRLPAHPLFRRLLAASGIPLAAPSANPFGYVSPTTAQHVEDSLGRRIKYILDGGPSEIGLESTILDLRDPRRPRLLRPGKITAAALESVLGSRVKRIKRLSALPAKSAVSAVPEVMLAPGMLTQHYSPNTPLHVHRRLNAQKVLGQTDAAQVAWVFLRRPAGMDTAARNVFAWADDQAATKPRRSPAATAQATLERMAHHLFALLRALDVQGWKAIHVELAPSGGLGDAINDRLYRASAKRNSRHPPQSRL